MANQWFRMYSEFASDAKVQMMSESYQRRYVMLLCLRCCNDDVTLHDDEIAFQLRISNEEWLETKTSFIAKNLIGQDNKPTAWDKRQFVSDSSNSRVKKHREKLKQQCNVTVTPPEQNRTDTEQNRTDTEKPRANKNRKRDVSLLPEDWSPSEKTREWCNREFGLRVPEDVERYVDAFRDSCKSHGYEYKDFDAAFKTCVRQDWPKIRSNGSKKIFGAEEPTIGSKAWIEREKAIGRAV